MIKVRILNCKDPALRSKIRRCSHYFIKELMPRKQRLSITITFDPRLLIEHNMSGSCMPEDIAVNRKHYEFSISIDSNLKFDETISILAHELTHVKQYASGELSYDGRYPNISIWRGKRIDFVKVKYKDHPWEKDAILNEIVLRDKLFTLTDIWK